MRNRFLTLSAALALVPTLAIGQQRPAQPTAPPANQPRPANPPAQQPAARPAQPPAQQPAARPATPPPAARAAGGARVGAVELTVGAGVAGFAKAITGTSSSMEVGLGGLLGIGYVLNQSWSIGAGVTGGIAKSSATSSTAYYEPFGSITYTPDVNAHSGVFVRAFGGPLIRKTPSHTGGAAGLGLGYFSNLQENLALRLEVGAQYAQFGGTSSADGIGTIGLSYYMGGGPPKDTDGDGVPDNKDRCANTPRGAIVDANGCPRDSDHDGVFDGLDRCPNTPANTPVDANGCPRDSDGDGVADNLDRCPNTPRGTPVDANGCPRDADGDGVPDNLDRCPNTPRGVPVDANGCPRDSDGDGVPDNVDRCPNTPANARPVDANGCPVDTDGDGVADYLDRCPNTAAGTRVDANGCPIEPDSDHDGVPDSRDRCPNTPAGRAVDANGCPLAELPAVGQALVLRNVTFRAASANLTPASNAVLDGIAASIQNVLRTAPTAKFEVDGYTDNRGVAARNRTLSQNRANAVMAYLVSKGIPAGALTARGFGPDNPRVPNTTAANRAQNRRVEIKRAS